MIASPHLSLSYVALTNPHHPLDLCFRQCCELSTFVYMLRIYSSAHPPLLWLLPFLPLHIIIAAFLNLSMSILFLFVQPSICFDVNDSIPLILHPPSSDVFVLMFIARFSCLLPPHTTLPLQHRIQSTMLSCTISLLFIIPHKRPAPFTYILMNVRTM